MSNIIPRNINGLSISTGDSEIYHLTEDELNRLTETFQNWFEQKRSQIRGKYWLTFLFLRYTGARISEVLNIDENRDIDFKNSAIELLRAGIPVTAVQQLLGHAGLNTTAMYLKYSNIEIQGIMKTKGLL